MSHNWLIDEEFEHCIADDLAQFVQLLSDETVPLSGKRNNRVLVFPPVTDHFRYLIHKVVRESKEKLHSFSIGLHDRRRTVVCRPILLLRDRGSQASDVEADQLVQKIREKAGRVSAQKRKARQNMERAQKRPAQQIYTPSARRNPTPAVQHCQSPQPSTSDNQKPSKNLDACSSSNGVNVAKSSMGRGRGRARPAMQVYVPRVKREIQEQAQVHQKNVAPLTAESGDCGKGDGQFSNPAPCSLDKDNLSNATPEAPSQCNNNPAELVDTAPSQVDVEVSSFNQMENVKANVSSLMGSKHDELTSYTTESLCSSEVNTYDDVACFEPGNGECISDFTINETSVTTATNNSLHVESIACSISTPNTKTESQSLIIECNSDEVVREDLAQNSVGNAESKSVDVNEHNSTSESQCTKSDLSTLELVQPGLADVGAISDDESKHSTNVTSQSPLEAAPAESLNVEQEPVGGIPQMAANIAVADVDLAYSETNVALDKADDTQACTEEATDVMCDSAQTKMLDDDKDKKMEASCQETDQNINTPDSTKHESVKSSKKATKSGKKEKKKKIAKELKTKKKAQLSEVADARQLSSPKASPARDPDGAEDVVGSEDDSWDTMFDESGECLDEDQVKELEAAVGKVKISKPVIDYLEFTPKDPELDDDQYGHLLEIYDFHSSAKTGDLMTMFIRNKDFDIKWVDDTHAIGIFSNSASAQDALLYSHPTAKTRPISQASRATKLKVKNCADFLVTTKERPATTAMTARRLVAASLGISTAVTPEKRQKEKQIIKSAKDKKREDNKAKVSAWDGSIIEEQDSPQTARTSRSAVESPAQTKKIWDGNYGKCAMDGI